MAEDKEEAVEPTTAAKDDSALRSVAKYKRGQNVDYKVDSSIRLTFLMSRKSKTRNFVEICKKCRNVSGNWHTMPRFQKCYSQRIEGISKPREWKRRIRSLKSNYAKK